MFFDLRDLFQLFGVRQRSLRRDFRAQRIQHGTIVGQAFEFGEAGVGLLNHAVLEIKMNFSNRRCDGVFGRDLDDGLVSRIRLRCDWGFGGRIFPFGREINLIFTDSVFRSRRGSSNSRGPRLVADRRFVFVRLALGRDNGELSEAARCRADWLGGLRQSRRPGRELFGRIGGGGLGSQSTAVFVLRGKVAVARALLAKSGFRVDALQSAAA